MNVLAMKYFSSLIGVTRMDRVRIMVRRRAEVEKEFAISADRLGRFMERSGVVPTTQFAYRKALDTCDSLLCMFHTLQSALESGQEARIVQINFSAAFHRVNHLGILYKLCSVGIGGSVLSILTQFLLNRSQQVMVDGCQSKLVNVVSGVPQGSVLGPLSFQMCTSEFFSFWKIS